MRGTWGTCQVRPGGLKAKPVTNLKVITLKSTIWILSFRIQGQQKFKIILPIYFLLYFELFNFSNSYWENWNPERFHHFTTKNNWPWRDSNSQSSDSKSDTLSIRPQGQHVKSVNPLQCTISPLCLGMIRDVTWGWGVGAGGICPLILENMYDMHYAYMYICIYVYISPLPGKKLKWRPWEWIICLCSPAGKDFCFLLVLSWQF